MRVVVVGAGITGLAAAWELERAGCDVTVVESERRAGGVIFTERRDGFILEGGADGWLASEPEIPALAAELGLTKRIVAQRARGSFHWTGTALEPLEDGQAAAALGIEVKLEDLASGFQSFAAGMGELVEMIVSRIGARVRSPVGISGIMSSRAGWRLAATGGAVLDAEAVVLAVPAYVAGRLLEQAGVPGARELAAVVYPPSITVSLAYRAEQIDRSLQGTGFVVGQGVPLQIRACTFASSKFPDRAPAGHVLLRAFLNPADGDPAARAHGDLAPILGIHGDPIWSRAFFWSKGIPRYPRDHARRVAHVRGRLARLAPLAIAGAGYDGAGVSACVRSGRESGRLIARLMAR